MYDHNGYGFLQVLENDEKPYTDSERLVEVYKPLMAWYEAHARILPWRENPEAYAVWISEIMLQQTRVEAVKPYFERFMGALPTVQDLAVVDDDVLMKLWEGLGYYNRARNLKKAAGVIVDQHGGVVPADFEQLLELPGIGRYTAGAVASIAYGIPAPAVDGNVLRVISRLLASHDDILKDAVKKRFEKELGAVMPQDDASRYNQALIEIGALVCVPNGQPKCQECPLYSLCLARKKDLISEIPVKTPKKKRRLEDMTVLLLTYKNQIALRKREDAGLLAGLYELPNCEGHIGKDDIVNIFGLENCRVADIEKLPDQKHIFTHVEWHMDGYRIELDSPLPPEYIPADRDAMDEEYPLPTAFAKYKKLIK